MERFPASGSKMTSVLARPVAGGSPAQRLAQSERAQHLARPERDHDVRLAGEPAGKAQPSRQLIRQIGALGIEAAIRLLEVREAGPVLQVEERTAFYRPGDAVGSPSELEVLERLVERDGEAEAEQVPRLGVAHRSVDRVLLARLTGEPLAAARVGEPELGPQPERGGDARIRLEGGRSPRFHALDGRCAEARAIGELPQGPAAAGALAVDGRAQLGRDAFGGVRSRGGGRSGRRTRRHSHQSQQPRPWRPLTCRSTAPARVGASVRRPERGLGRRPDATAAGFAGA
ncbi:MAG: hypothetical protein A2X23_07170 [Chloroflexi bacterium GWC2_73_18]|nr:MAG: hypothetical protein A2X23_07170 [Chloroflexi bacterium GWC2_73_18]